VSGERERGSRVRSRGPAPLRRVRERAGDLAVAGIAAVAGIGAIQVMPQQVGGEDLRALGDMSSPAFFPALGALLLTVLGALLALRTLLAPPPEASAATHAIHWRRVLLLMALVSGYVGLIFAIGMVPASMLFIPAAALAYGSRRFVAIGVLALAIPALVHVLFERILRVLLPEGWLL